MYEKAIDVERGPPCDLLERIRSRALRIAFGRSHRNGEERSERIGSRKHDVDKGPLLAISHSDNHIGIGSAFG